MKNKNNIKKNQNYWDNISTDNIKYPNSHFKQYNQDDLKKIIKEGKNIPFFKKYLAGEFSKTSNISFEKLWNNCRNFFRYYYGTYAGGRFYSVKSDVFKMLIIKSHAFLKNTYESKNTLIISASITSFFFNKEATNPNHADAFKRYPYLPKNINYTSIVLPRDGIKGVNSVNKKEALDDIPKKDWKRIKPKKCIIKCWLIF